MKPQENLSMNIKRNHKVKNIIFSLLFLLFLPFSISAQNQLSTLAANQDWGDWGIVKGTLPTSFFAGVWTKVYAPMGSGSKGNDFPVSFQGPEGNIVGVSGNCGPSPNWMYNANTMTGDNKGNYLADWAYYFVPKTEQECRGWVYIGFYIQRVGSSTKMTTYVKINTTGKIEQSPTDTENRIYNLNEIHVGGTPNSGMSKMYIQHLRIYAMPNTPTSAQINAMAANTAPDPPAWADWPLIAGGTNDVSGNGHTITINGKWYPGIEGPNLTTSPISVDSIAINKKKITVDINQTSQLESVIYPVTATNQNATWTSSNNNVATVSSTGLITAKSKGSAVITVKTTDGAKTAICNVIVTANVTTIAVNLAITGTAYAWSDIPSTTSTSDVSKVAMSGLNDSNIEVDNSFTDANATGNWQAAGVVWATAQPSITSVKFYNGVCLQISDNGVFGAAVKIQSSADGTTWTDANWNCSPTYEHTSAVSNAVYTFSGSTFKNVKGIRVIGQVRTNDSWSVKVKEVEAFSEVITANNISSNLDETITLYPNPAQDLLNLKFGQDFQNVQLEVFDALGCELMNSTLNGSIGKVNIQQLNSGIYVLKVTIDQKSKLIRFVKQ